MGLAATRAYDLGIVIGHLPRDRSAFRGWFARTSVRTLSCIARIRLELRRSRIGIDQPDPPVAVVIEQWFEIPAWNLSRPNDFRGVDLRGVIHPLVGYVMAWSIANYNEMLLGRSLQLPGDLRARQIPTAPWGIHYLCARQKHSGDE